jgi:uroporphyrinogen-III synthase
VTGRLGGRRIVTTRAAEQAGRLRGLLQAEGATVIEIPTIAFAEPADGGAALRAALDEVWDWVVVTSANGATRVAAAARSSAAAASSRWAVVGPGTADALRESGVEPALVPVRFVAEGLLEAFPPPPLDRGGRVLVAQAERARPVLSAGLRERGWEVTTVTAYRTIAADAAPAALAQLSRADAVAFTSGSTVDALVAAARGAPLPPVVVCIGPVTAAAAEAHGLPVAAVADPHDLGGLLEALVGALAGRPA